MRNLLAVSEQVLNERIENDSANLTPGFWAIVHVKVKVTSRQFRSHQGAVLHTQVTHQQLVLPFGHSGGARKELGIL